MRNAYKMLVRNLKSVDGRIILKWLLGMLSDKVWTGFNWLRIGIYSGFL
jgi:hypothetical protein